MKPVNEMTEADWLAFEQRHKLRGGADNRIIDDPEQLGFGFGEQLNLPARRKRRRTQPNTLPLFDLSPST